MTTKYSSGQINGEGRVVKNNVGENFKTGYWVEFSKAGDTLSAGNYGIDYFTLRCPPVEKEYYSYRKGDWLFFYQNGQLKAKGEFKTHSFRDDDSEVKFGITDSTWQFYDENGYVLSPDSTFIYNLEKVQMSMEDSTLFYYVNRHLKTIELNFEKPKN